MVMLLESLRKFLCAQNGRMYIIHDHVNVFLFEEQQTTNNAEGTVMDTDAADTEVENAKGTEVNSSTEGQESIQNEAEEDDDDEIELHAGEDDVEDESEDAGWSRRTRSSQSRGEGSSK